MAFTIIISLLAVANLALWRRTREAYTGACVALCVVWLLLNAGRL